MTANECTQANNAGLDHAEAFQNEIAPLGDTSSNMCVGTWNSDAGTAPVSGDRLRLQGCGVNAGTLWIADTTASNNSDHLPHYTHDGGTPYIDAASNNYAKPLVVTETTGAEAYQRLEVQTLISDSNGVVSDRQLVRLLLGS